MFTVVRVTAHNVGNRKRVDCMDKLGIVTGFSLVSNLYSSVLLFLIFSNCRHTECHMLCTKYKFQTLNIVTVVIEQMVK